MSWQKLILPALAHHVIPILDFGDEKPIESLFQEAFLRPKWELKCFL